MELFQNVLGMVSEPDLLTTGFDVTRPNDPIDGLFDDERTDNLVARWNYIAAEYQIPQMAQFHAFDTVAQKSVRAPIDQRNIEKGLIKVKRNTSELLYELQNRGVNTEAGLYDYVMNDINTLADEVVTRTKVAKNELLATGKVTIKENNIDNTVDYGVPAGNLAFTLDFGAGASSDVPTQIQTIVDMAAAAGVQLTGMVCSRAVLSKMRQNAAIQKAVNGISMEGVLVTNAALTAYLDSEFGISRVITNDQSYSLPWTVGSNGRPVVTQKRYFPADKVSFFGTGNGMRLGTGLWGVPPEEQIARFEQVAPSSENPYVYMTQWAEKDPAVVWTKASALFMPVLFNPNSLYVATVTETPGA
jgi:hypothetical protein